MSPHCHGVSLPPGCQVAFGTNHTAAVSSCPGHPQKREVCCPSSCSSSLYQHGKPSPSQSAQNIQEAGHAVRIKQHSTISFLKYKLHRSIVTCAGATCSPKLSLYSSHRHRPIFQSSFTCLTLPIPWDFIPTECFNSLGYCPYTIPHPSWHQGMLVCTYCHSSHCSWRSPFRVKINHSLFIS